MPSPDGRRVSFTSLQQGAPAQLEGAELVQDLQKMVATGDKVMQKIAQAISQKEKTIQYLQQVANQEREEKTELEQLLMTCKLSCRWDDLEFIPPPDDRRVLHSRCRCSRT